jgi:hypothetical protein
MSVGGEAIYGIAKGITGYINNRATLQILLFLMIRVGILVPVYVRICNSGR